MYNSIFSDLFAPLYIFIKLNIWMIGYYHINAIIIASRWLD